MTIEQVKEEAKKRFSKEISDEQAQAWLDSNKSGELADDELDNVAGGGCDSSGENKSKATPWPPLMAGKCPRCGSEVRPVGGLLHGEKYKCMKCGQWFIAYSDKEFECIDN